MRCGDFSGGALTSPQGTCIRYTPDPGFRGVDEVPYTISDGRGGTASATYYVTVDNPAIAVDSVTPASGPPEGGHTVVVSGEKLPP